MPADRIPNAMTVDVEEHFQVSAFEDCVDRADWSRHKSRVEANTDRLLELFADHGVLATFFVLGWVAERHPGLVARIAAAGHEVASHGYSHRLIYNQSREEFGEEVRRSKQVLEEITGQPVLGHRAASFSIGRDNLWALDELAEAGFAYDSSLFPVVHDRYGIPGAPRAPYRLRTPEGHGLIEVPPSTVLLRNWTLPVAGGGYLRLFPAWLTHWAIKRLNHTERMPAVVYIHPWEVDPDQPRIKQAPLLRRARHSVNLRTTHAKLDRLMARFPFVPMRTLIETLDLRKEIALSSVKQVA